VDVLMRARRAAAIVTSVALLCIPLQACGVLEDLVTCSSSSVDWQDAVLADPLLTEAPMPEGVLVSRVSSCDSSSGQPALIVEANSPLDRYVTDLVAAAPAAGWARLAPGSTCYTKVIDDQLTGMTLYSNGETAGLLVTTVPDPTPGEPCGSPP
jgi:hypothetical protein